MNTDKFKIAWIDLIALGCIGLVSIGYIRFESWFAELNIKLPFLDFPIFIGEWLTGLCLELFILKLCFTPFKLDKWKFIILLYFLFVVIKAIFGYQEAGAFALRNAALFYYPVFVIFTYYFFNKEIILRMRYLIIPVVFIFFLTKNFYIYSLLTCFIITFILIQTIANLYIRYGVFALLVIITPYIYFFNTARMMILAHLAFATYLIIIGFMLIKIPRYQKVISTFICLMIVGYSTFRFTRENTLSTIFNFSQLRRVFDDFDRDVQAKKDTFVFEENLALAAYNPNSAEERSTHLKIIQDNQTNARLSGTDAVGNKNSELNQGENQIIDANLSAEEVKTTIKEVEVNNAVFRLFVWRDMFKEYRESLPVFGFSFGKPFRSKSLEILSWARSEWGRDGWIAPHNSFFHIIYRFGVIGILFIIGIITLLTRMILGFINIRSWTGILLCGVLLSWFVAANFLLIFELPYTAIPIWSLYGVTFAYYQSKIKPEKAAYGLEK